MSAILLWTALTLAAYALALRAEAALGRSPLANPVLISCLLIAGLLVASGTPVATYLGALDPLSLLLGPATVALALPIFRERARIRAAGPALLAGLLAGSLTAIASALVIAGLLGAEGSVLASLAPKSVTTPIALGLAEGLGGIPALAAAIVILTGIVGAVLGPWLFRRLGLREEAACGLALGVAAHGIGTARAFDLSPTLGAWAGLGLGLNGLLTAFLLPLLWPLIESLWR